METVKIKYSKKRRNFSLIFSLAWFISILAQFISSEQHHWFDYVIPVLGILITLFYVQQYVCPYVVIENGILVTEYPFGKKINLNDIKQIKSFAGDIILKGISNDVRIATALMDQKAETLLKKELKKLDVRWT